MEVVGDENCSTAVSHKAAYLPLFLEEAGHPTKTAISLGVCPK
jgi:hypothetical protein